MCMTLPWRSSVASRACTLVVHPGALGDVLLTIPALRALRRVHPDDMVTLAAPPRLGALVQALGEVDEAVDVESLGLHQLFVDNGEGEAHPLLAGCARAVCWMGAGDATFARRLRALVPDVVLAPSTTPGERVWRHLLRTVDGDDTVSRAPIVLREDHLADGRRVLIEAGWDGATPLLFVQPGTGSAAKRWPAEGFAQVVEQLRRQRAMIVVVHLGPGDRAAANALITRLAGPVATLVEPSLPALAGALGQIALYVGNDSGVSHLAAAVGAPAVVAYRADLVWWEPWTPGAAVVTVTPTAVRRKDVAAIVSAARLRLRPKD
jgi:heptosyltransferase III